MNYFYEYTGNFIFFYKREKKLKFLHRTLFILLHKIPEDDTESKACEVNDDRHKNDLDNLCHHQNHNHQG